MEVNMVVLVGKISAVTSTIIVLDDDLVAQVPPKIMEQGKDYLKSGTVIGIKGKIGKGNSILVEKITFITEGRK